MNNAPKSDGDKTTRNGAFNDEAEAITGMLSGYDLNHPDMVTNLPKILREASDVTILSPTEIAMVQDEKGSVYLYSLKDEKVVRKIKFGPKGDYEGIAPWGADTMFVLRSDGKLYRITDWHSSTPTTSVRKIDIPTKDNEGLCYDPVTDSLLISPKSRWKKKRGGGKNLRPIFAMNPETGEMWPEPLFVLHIEDILAFAKKNHLTIPGKLNKKGKFKEKLEFNPAALAVRPETGEIFVISSVDRVIVSFDRSKRITGFSMLDKNLFIQPEGIDFLPDGTLVVVNESPNKKPGLLLFKSKRMQ